MKVDFLKRLQSEVLVSDGAMGTMLQTAGYTPNACPEKWGIENTDKLQHIHRGYLDAGADILLTNTFGGNTFKLQKYNLSEQVHTINQRAAEIAVDVAGDKAYVAGDIGPTGEFLEPIGQVTESACYEAFAEQAEGLKAGGVDVIIIETMMALNEIQIAIKAAKETELPVIASMAFTVVKDGFRTIMGVAPKEAATGMIEAGADVIGANCGDVMIADMPALIAELRLYVGCTSTGQPTSHFYVGCGADTYIIIQPNAGRPQLIEGKTVFLQSPQDIAAGVDAALAAGANIIGGCCGTTPEHIRQIAHKVKG